MKVFVVYGDVEQAYLIHDRETGQKKGFGYVMMRDEKIAVTLASRGFINYGSFQIKVKIHQGKLQGKAQKAQKGLRKTESLHEQDSPQYLSQSKTYLEPPNGSTNKKGSLLKSRSIEISQA